MKQRNIGTAGFPVLHQKAMLIILSDDGIEQESQEQLFDVLLLQITENVHPNIKIQQQMNA